ncbi:MmgE/PrpD family protein [Rhodococcus hoagii]|nr:MmgE/PrpD family protein [Prescottella equi]
MDNATSQVGDVLKFVVGLTWQQVPSEVRRRLGMLTLDASVAARAGTLLSSARIMTDYVATAMSGDEATCVLDGRRVSAPGAALANGTVMNAVDYDDGHPLAKGHPGAVIIPAALAVAEATGASHEEFLLAMLIGYEVGIRAGMAQHDRWPLFHSSGTWGAVGAAAASARLLKLSPEQVDAAIGLAEYHAPVDLIMRAVAEPTMAKDAMGWGAHVGVTSAQLAAAGFTAHRSEFVADRLRHGAADLGAEWQVMHTYVKPFPCCRWVHPALAGAEQVLRTLGRERLDPAEVTGVRVRTFQAAADLARMVPSTSEEAQFNLLWPLAAYLTSGGFGLDSVTSDLGDPVIARMAGLVEVVVDPDFEAGFPAVRRSRLTVTLADGRTIDSGPCTAAGNADDPHWEDVVRAKFPAVPDEHWAAFDAEPLTSSTRDLTAVDPLSALTYPLSTTQGENMNSPEQTKRLAAIDALAQGFRDRARRYDDEAIFPTENFAELYEADLLALTLPEKWGGAGLWSEGGFAEYYALIEHLAAVDAPTAQLFQVHSHALGMLSHAATDAQMEKYVVPIAKAGELVASVGSEATPGKTNVGTSSSQLVRNEQGQWVLNCTKHFASLGPGASHYIIWLALPGTEHYDHRTVAVLVPRDVPEVELIDNWDVLGMRSTVSWAVKVTDYVLPDDAIFGEPGWWETDDTRTFTLAFAANHLGAARGAFDFTVDWVRARPELAASELIQFQLGELAAKLSSARAGLFDAAAVWDAGRRSEGEFRGVHALTVAKQVALEVTGRCLDVCGSRSMFKTYPLERFYRDTRAFSLHYRVDNYTRNLGATLLAEGFSVNGNGGLTPAEV